MTEPRCGECGGGDRVLPPHSVCVACGAVLMSMTFQRYVDQRFERMRGVLDTGKVDEILVWIKITGLVAMRLAVTGSLSDD